ncbi:TetR/AcrR family transcriptional regulator C-terminal domain-containing protein [Isoptericola sp. NPDC056618]|uniref:TetR/AcrR family transcriptional regulator C-terminal domain-containing protein n=1 Tax=Isoptericola sp. NPDC056618 TaxID=3345878 RepID=UPI0036AD7B71
MSTERTAVRGATRRAIGVRAGLTLPKIVDAARSLDPDALTMQALADHLGVDRKALNHHVSDRDTLLALVALDTFSSTFSAVEIAAHAGWQDACRSYARGFTESAIAAGVLAERIRLTDAYVTKVLEPTEAVLQTMVAAGFDDETAMRTLSALTNICLAYARDVVLATRSNTSPRTAILRDALAQRDADKLPTLARIAELPVTTYDQTQLDLSIDTFIAGAEARQRNGRTSAQQHP